MSKRVGVFFFPFVDFVLVQATSFTKLFLWRHSWRIQLRPSLAPSPLDVSGKRRPLVAINSPTRFLLGERRFIGCQINVQLLWMRQYSTAQILIFRISWPSNALRLNPLFTFDLWKSWPPILTVYRATGPPNFSRPHAPMTFHFPQPI